MVFVKSSNGAYSAVSDPDSESIEGLPHTGSNLLHSLMQTALIRFAPIVLVAVLMCGESCAEAMYDCKNEAGQVKFTDRPCPEAVRSKPISVRKESNLKERKAENDARISRDKALANNMQASRDSEEQAGFAAQVQQVQAARAIDSKVSQERSSQNSRTTSTVHRDPGLSQ